MEVIKDGCSEIHQEEAGYLRRLRGLQILAQWLGDPGSVSSFSPILCLFLEVAAMIGVDWS